MRSASVPAPSTWSSFDAGSEYRSLSATERSQLERRGCEADDWDQVRVAPGFQASNCRNVRFSGSVRIGATGGLVALPDGTLAAAGLRDVRIHACRIGDHALVERVTLLSRVWVGPGAVIFDCGRVVHQTGSSFGHDLRVGVRQSGADRSVPAYAEMSFEALGAAASPRRAEVIADLRTRADRYAGELPAEHSVLAAGARLLHTPVVQGFCIGPHAQVDAAAWVEDVTMLSDEEAPATISSGAHVRTALMQRGSAASGQAALEQVFLAEFASVERLGIVRHSALGSNTAVAEGEVSASVVGPFCGFHHQALLVAACWPEGRGNVGYGANVGSNHTGRAPDQEIRCGEGTFFGLGVNIKMPADFSDAPYLLIATGTDTLPQRISMPFSLVLPPTDPAAPLPPAYNEIRPGWGLSHNAYGIFRNAWKFARRDQTGRLCTDLFTPRTVASMEAAAEALEGLSGKAWYTGRDLADLGRNGMSESVRVSAADTYRFYLRWLGLRQAFDAWSRGESPGANALVRWLGPERARLSKATLVALYLEAETRIFDSILACKKKDDRRGPSIIADYSEVHAPAENDAFVQDRAADLERLRDVARSLA